MVAIWCPGRESYATTDTTDRCLSLIWWRECSARWRTFANAKPTYRVARGPQHTILAIGGKRCPAVGSRDVCPPKAKVPRSNRVGCAIFSTEHATATSERVVRRYSPPCYRIVLRNRCGRTSSAL